MRVRAEYESAVACREELKKVEEELRNVNENTSPKKIEQLTQRYVKLTQQLEDGLSTIGKLGYYTRNAFQKIGDIISGSNKDVKDSVTANENLYSTMVRRLQIEERITDEFGKQKEKTEEQLKVAKEGLERNSTTLDKLRDKLFTKYDGKAEGFWSSEDQAKMARGRESVGNWEAEVKDKERQLEVIDDVLEKSGKKIEDFKEKLKDFDLPPLDLKVNIDDMVNQIADGEKKVGDLKSSLSSLYDELNERADFQGAKNKMYDIYAEIGDKKKEIDELQQKIDGFSISSLVSQHQSLSAFADEVSEKMKAEKETISSLQKQQEGLNEQSAMYQAIQDKIDLHTAEKERLAQVLDMTNKSIAETKVNIDSETKAHEDNQRMVKELTNDVSELNAEYEKQKGIVNNSDANKAAVAGIKNEIKETKEQISQTTDTTERLKDVLEKVDAAYKNSQSGADFKSQIDNLVSQIDEGEKKVDGLKERITMLNELSSMISQGDKSSISDKLSADMSTVDSMKKQIEDLQKAVDNTSLESLKNSQQELSEKLNTANENLRTEESIINELKTKQSLLNEESAMYAKIQSEIDYHTAEQEKYARQIDNINAQISKTTQLIDDEEKAQERRQKKINELSADVQKLTSDCEIQKEILSSSSDEEALEKVKTKVKETNDEIKEATNSTNALREELEKTGAAFENSKNVYKGFARTGTETTPATRVFTNETDYNRSIELHDHAANLESQITNGVESGSLSIEKLQSLQEELKAVQAELIPLEEKARDTALLLGDSLGQKAAALTQKLFESNKAVEDAERSYNNLNKELEKAKDFLKTMEENSSDQKGISEAKQKVDELTASLNEQSEALAKAKAEQKDAQEAINKTSGELGDALDELKSGEGILADFDKAVSMLPAPLRNVASGVKGVGNAMKILAKNPLMIALGALVLVLQSVWQWFNKSAEGQRAFAKISGYVGGIITRLEEVVVKFGGAVFNVIKNIVKALASPKKAIKSVIDFLADQVKNRLKGIVDAFVGAGQTIANVFVDLWESIKKGKLDFSNTQKSLKKVLDGVLAIGTGFNNVTDKIYDAAEATVDWVKETHNVAMESKAIAEEERELGLEIEKNREKTLKLQKSMAELQATMRNTNLSKAERKKALEEYKKQVAEQAKIQRDFAEKRRSLHQRKLDLDEPDTIEEMQQQAALANAVLSADVAMQRQLTALTRVSNSINKGETGKSKARLNEEYQLLLNENAQKQAKQIRENGYIIEQARINAMEEGTARTLAQMKLDFKKEQDAAVEYEDELKRQKLKRARDEFYKNPKNKKKTFDLSSVDTTMTEQERKVEASKISDAENKYADSLKKLLTPYETFQEKQQKKAADFMALKNHLADEEIRKTMEIAELTEQLADADDIQKTNIQKQIDEREKEISVLEKRRDVIDATMRTQDEELNKLREFLKEYGSFDQKRQAIKDDYADKIAKARAEGDYIGVATLEQKQEQEMSSTRIEEVKATMDWEGLFNNLESYSSDYLDSVRKDLAALLTDPDIQPDDAQVVAEKIAQIDSVMNEKLGSTFRWVNDYLTTQKRLQMEAATAAKEYEKALKEQIDAQVNLDSARGNVLGQLSYEEQQKLEEKGITPDNLYKNAKDIFTILGIDEDSEKAKKLKESLKALAEQEVKTAAATGKATKAQAKKKNAEEKADGMKATEKVAAWMKGVNENVQKYLGDVPELMNKLGMGKLGENVQKGLNGVNDAAGAAADFASGNYVGAALKGISAVQNFGEAFGAWSNSNRAQVEAENNKLAVAMSVNTEAVNRLTDAMKKATPTEALQYYEEAKAALKMNEEAEKRRMQNNAGMYDGGHSLNYDLGDANGTIQSIFRLLKKGIKSGEGYDLGALLRNLSGEDWNQLYKTNEGRALLQQLGQAIAGAEDEGNYNGMFQDILDFINTYNDEAYQDLLDQFNETVTHISFDSVYDGFVSTIMNMDKKASEFSQDFEGYLREAIYESMAAENLKPYLKDWYGAFASMMSKNNGKLTTTDINQLLHQGGTYTDENGKTAEFQSVDALKQIGLDIRAQVEALGLYNGKNGNQSATANSISNISYDQADSLVGIGMAQQMAIEQSRDRLDILNTRFDDVMGGMVEQRNISADSREILAGMAIHVEEIRDGVVDTIVPAIKDMRGELTKVRKVLEEQ